MKVETMEPRGTDWRERERPLEDRLSGGGYSFKIMALASYTQQKKNKLSPVLIKVRKM